MDLRRLEVTRLPGIDDAFVLEFGSGLTVVQGPNGAGKSSVVRAILAMLLPRAEADPRLDVAASFIEDDRRWYASRRGGEAPRWQDAAGNPVEPPALPRHAGAYRLGLLDLHRRAGDDDDAALAREIRNRMAGGYDVEGLLTDGLRVPRSTSGTTSLVAAARAEVETIRREQTAIAADETELPPLQRAIAAGDAAAERLRRLEQAERLCQARRAAAEAAADVAAFPAWLVHLRGDEPERRSTLEAAIAAEQQALAGAEAALALAEHERGGAGLPAGAPSAQEVEDLRGRLQPIHADLAECQRLDTDAAAAGAAAVARGCSLDPAWPAERLEAVPPAAVTEAADLLRRSAALDGRLDTLEGLLASEDAAGTAGTPQEAADPAAMREAIAHLAAWLGHAAPAPAAGRRLAAIAASLLVLAGMMLALVRGDLTGWIASVAGVVILTLALGPDGRARRAADGRHAAEQAFAATGVAAPAAWLPPQVQARLRQLAGDLAAAEATTGRGAWRRQLQAEQARLQATRTALASASRALAERHALDPLATPVAAHEYLARVADYQAALAEHGAAVARRDAVRDRLQTRLTDLARALAPHGIAPPPDPAAAEAAVSDLCRRAETHRAASAAADHQRDAADAARRRLAAAESQLVQLFATLDLEPGANAELGRGLALLPAYRDAVLRRDATASIARAAADEAAGAADILAGADLPDQQRHGLIEAARAQAGATGELRVHLGRIEGSADLARRGVRLQAALAAHDGALARWQAERDDAVDNLLARQLLELAADEHDSLDRPASLLRAQTLLALFTAGRYELRVTDAGFGAIDVVHDRPVSLGELSDGTRAQLLLAARLAFVETGRIPLLLDEALIATDPARFQAVAAALLALVCQGQQIVALTASPATVAAWRQAAEKAGTTASVIDLAAVRTAANLAPLETLAPPVLTPVPAPPPAGADAATYARLLGVPPLDPHRPAATAHLFHLLPDDLLALHACLEAGPTTWAALTTLARAFADHDDAPPPAWPLARGRDRVAALDAFLAAWRVGRGRPLDRAALAAHERLATSRHAAAIEDLRAACEGDAAALIAALQGRRVAGVRTALVEELAAYLEAEGYLDPRPPLTADEMVEDVIRKSAASLAAGVVTGEELRALVDYWRRAVTSARRS